MPVAHPSRPIRQPHWSGLLYAGLAVVSGLVAWAGLDALLTGGPALGASWATAGLGGVAGSVILAARSLSARANGASGYDRIRSAALTRVARVLMLIAAVVTAIVGVTLAPAGDERGFVIGISFGLAVTLGLYALLVPTRLR